MTHKLLNRRTRFLSACSEESRFDPARKAVAFASPDRKATNRASTSSQPIRFLSPRPLHGDFSPFVTLNVWAKKQISGSFGKERNQKPGFTHPSHCLTYCPFRCPLAWAPSWSGWRGTSSARILPPIASWHVPVMQVHDSLWQRVLGSSCWGGARGRSRGREPSPCEQKARRSRTASRKMSALWVTQVIKVTNQATVWVNGQGQGYFKKTLNQRALWEGRAGLTDKLKPEQHPPKLLNTHQRREMPHKHPPCLRSGCSTSYVLQETRVWWPTLIRHFTPKKEKPSKCHVFIRAYA